METLFCQPVRVNGRKFAIIACTAAYHPAYQTPENKYAVFVTGNILGSLKSHHATPQQAIAAAEKLLAQVNGAFFPTVDGYPPHFC